MSLVYLLLALVWVGADFAALIYLYFTWGFAPVLGMMIATAILGVWLFRWQMRGVWRAFQQHLANASLPGAPAAEGFLLFAAACLLIAPFPGMDAVGLLLMVGPVRRFFARRIQDWVLKRFEPGPRSFVFQMGGFPSQGWPTPEYPEAVPGLNAAQPTDPNAPSAALHGAAESDEEIEEGEFRTVPATDSQ